ncbi:hypothetical protein [Streptomyces netropsis]|uniref:DUF3592 domain-containing protein n=1 Tax=Streptomyces netropsis TaxID=55404 RepID=A0A7W7PDL0_STRNE|nr:hypothetical protein [Streptomyces netropsis]MBB4885243.1 hypothetical protein [Streptomyces netropsis]
MNIGTRLTGWATLLAAYAAVVAGVIPLRELPPKRQQLWLLGLAAGCALCWICVSWLVTARRRAVLRKRASRKRYEPRSSRLVCWVLGFAIALASGAALCQGVGPDGPYGEWLAKVGRADGGTYDVRIQRIVGEPRSTDVEINDVDEFASTIEVVIPFDSGSRRVTVENVHTRGMPEEGRTVQLRYAPSRPDLGVRETPDNDIGTFVGRLIALPAIWVLTFAAGVVTGMVLHGNEFGVRSARRFAPRVHLPAAALLACGAGLVLPLLTGFPATGTGWALAAGAATTPWLALVWVSRAIRTAGATGAS